MAILLHGNGSFRSGAAARVLAAGALGLATVSGGKLQAQNSADFAAMPPLLQAKVTPRVMLLMSNDQQLFHKAYSDYSDLDGDGELDTSYNDAFDYYGYFNSNFCYDYDATQQRFEPNGATSSGHQCGGNWSGNFLNWASMTRMDIIRRVFYGGMRSTDTATDTVLQRALLPTDAHAFVKVYAGSDIGRYTPYGSYSEISLCNVTAASGRINVVDESTSPPLLRVAEGSYPLWSATEVVQCLFQEEAGVGRKEDRPSTVASAGDLVVRVHSCVTGQDAAVGDYCRAYGSTPVYKPAGLLQENSENGSMRFGLMTGTHEQKASGGILRRNITALAGNADPALDEVDLATGQFRYRLSGSGFSGGIIETLDSMRIAGWNYDDHKYDDCESPGIKVPTFLAEKDKCRDWGNPLAEMYMEALRYFAANGNAPIAGFSTGDDSTLLSGMGTEAWVDPLSTAEPCAQCAIIVLSTGLNSFDADDLSEVKGLPGIADVSGVEAMTNAVGVAEGLFGIEAIVGNADGNSNDNSCVPKTLGDFSDVLGMCPELPSLQGSYHLAGLANYAQTTDLRPETAFEDMQRVDTYTVALAESLPNFSFVTADGSEIGVVPACRSSADGTYWSDCSIVDAKVAVKTAHYTRIDIAWEDSLWGHDYDMDGIASIEVCTAVGAAALTECAYQGAVPNVEYANYQEWKSTAAASELQVRVSVPTANAAFHLKFGFIVAGSVADQAYFGALRPGGSNYTCLISGVCSDTAKASMVWAAPELITAGTSNARLLENPLWYAAKYGNFYNSKLKTMPTNSSEWDGYDLDGNAVADGIPDAYFPVSNPAKLGARLNRVVGTIEQRAASGTSVAVTLERRDGVGATFQAYYFPSYKEQSGKRRVAWVGGLQALFLDGDLSLREDSDGDGVLGADDEKINLFYDGSATVVQRLNVDGTIKETVPFTRIRPIWDAKNWLAGLSDAQVTTQRNYGDTTGRHILTWMDQDLGAGPDGRVDAGEVVSFDKANVVDGDAYRILNVADAASGENLVNYIRGSDAVPGMRSRTVRMDGDSQARVWRLGDIVHSSPVVVGRPGDGYDVAYRDISYTDFRNQYLYRRQVVYAGANDGMIHAFNAGFYSLGSSAFTKGGTHPVTGAAVSEYDLGAELWAYVPRNLLPHLRWLGEENYPHVYYVDGEPKAYDVNIFTPDDTHPGGWGTILVVGFRLGGGEIALDLDGDAADDFTSRSAYVVLDITDPESPPKLLAEITDPNLGFTTGLPALVKGRMANLTTGAYDAAADAWYLAFGSGPAGTSAATRRVALADGVSHQSARLYLFNLTTLQFEDMDGATDGLQPALDTGVLNSFVGDLTAVDWDRNYQDDALYFGLVEGLAPASPSGSLNRLRFSMDTSGSAPVLTLAATPISTMLDPDRPFQGAPVAYFDLAANRQWVLAGTGRYLTAADNAGSYTNRFYGLMEPLGSDGAFSNAAIDQTKLANTTNLLVLSNNAVYDVSGTPVTPAPLKSGAGALLASVENFSALTTTVRAAGGWFNDLGKLLIDTDSGGVAIESGEARNYNGALAIGTGVGFVKYAPDQNVCTPTGYSSLRFVDARTGTASRGIFYLERAAIDYSITANASVLQAESAVKQGAISKMTLVRTADSSAVGVSDNYGGIQFEKIGSLPPLGHRQGWRELDLH